MSENSLFRKADYQRIAKERAGARLIALMPQSIEESRRYLDKLGIEVSDVRQLQTGALGVTGTPTLILVNNEGAVVNSWVGRLPAEKEVEVLSSLKSGGLIHQEAWKCAKRY
jgi:thioredoxin-related protein